MDFFVYCFTDYSSSSVRLISSYALRGALYIFFKRQKATEQTAFVPDRQKSIFCSNWKELLSYEQFAKSMENYIQSSELLTLNSFLFVAARPVFCCLQALV